MNLKPILSHWITTDSILKIEEFGSGLIHKTYRVKTLNGGQFILQEINTTVFKKPEIMSENIRMVSEYLSQNAPDYIFPSIITTKDKNAFLEKENKCWRLSRFITNSYSLDTLSKPEQAYQAAAAFGKLSRHLEHIDLSPFKETIDRFHNLGFRFQEFTNALENTTKERKLKAELLIQFYFQQKGILETFKSIQSKKIGIPLRIQHHDTKVNNALFDKYSQKAITVCDLDTLMPGYFISDLGDMVRTYTSSEDENSKNWSQIKVREDYLKALIEGYLSEMEQVLTPEEKGLIPYAGSFMIYMQGLRFLTDFLNGDQYYPVSHSLQNFDRAKNQKLLLEDYQNRFSSSFFESFISQ
ncbi:phosphotransferase enzyme family protein [Jiulongibacter sp. NS-SX5]|uniref:phosphotransferase enzyme family protein n=1 Tax=Jiulongibacter sp. NS-SX5 TaxID=3463854 RepID=UPI00405A1182